MTPEQALWAELFHGEPPSLDVEKVAAIIDSLPDMRERKAVRLRYGFEGQPLSLDEIGRRLPRADGGLGLSRQSVQVILASALGRLRHSSRRRAWEQARKEASRDG